MQRELINVNRRTIIVLSIIVVILVAVLGITRWQRAAATERFLEDIAGKDYSKVLDAMRKLATRGGGITPRLLDGHHLQSQHPAARWRSAVLLGEVGTRQAWEPLIGALSDKVPEVRSAAAVALGKLQVVDAGAPLRSTLSDGEEEPCVRGAAARALGLLEDDAAVALLGDTLTKTVEAWEAKAWQAHKAVETAEEALETAKDNLEKSREQLSKVRTDPDEPGDEIEKTEEELETQIEDQKQAIEDARKALKDAGESGAEARDDVLAVDGRTPQQIIAAAKRENTEAEGSPAKPAQAGQTEQQEAAEEDAGEQQATEEQEETAEEPEEAEVEGPTDTTLRLRVACVNALAAIGSLEATEYLKTATDQTKEPVSDVRTAAAYAHADIGSNGWREQATEGIVGALIDATEDDVGDVRTAAIHALGSVAVTKELKQRVKPVLERAVEDKFYWVREAARDTAERLELALPSD